MQYSVELEGMSPFAYPAKEGVYAQDGKLTRHTKRFVCEAASADEARALFCSVLGVTSAAGKFAIGRAGKEAAPPALVLVDEVAQPAPAGPDVIPVSEVHRALAEAGRRIDEAHSFAHEAAVQAADSAARAGVAEAGRAAAEIRLRELEAKLKAPKDSSQAETPPALG